MPLPEQNPLKKIMHTSPFISSEPVLLGVLESSEEFDSKDSLHFCEDERLSSPSTEFEPLPVSLDYVGSSRVCLVRGGSRPEWRKWRGIYTRGPKTSRCCVVYVLVGTSDLGSELPTGPVQRTLGFNREILPTKLYETLGMCSKMY